MSDQSENRSTSAERQAVALGYDGASAPKVLAKGFGELAEQIIEVAAQEDIYVHQDEVLARFLSNLETGDEIPRELYVLVAEVISFAYMLNGRFPESWAKVYNKISTQA